MSSELGQIYNFSENINELFGYDKSTWKLKTVLNFKGICFIKCFVLKTKQNQIKEKLEKYP